MRRIIVLTILVLVAFAGNVKAQSTWDHPWSGASHYYLATVTDPENDNPVRWYVATNPSGSKKAVYNTDYTFVTSGYNPATGLLEGKAIYLVGITWGANVPDKTDFYIVIEVDDNKTGCTNRMSLHVQVQSVFNAFVVDNIADPSCPGSIVNPLWEGGKQTDIGNSELIFKVGRQNSLLGWQFEYKISESSAQPFSIDSIRFVEDLSAVPFVFNQAGDLKTGEVSMNATKDWVLAYVYVRNQTGVSLHLNFDLITSNGLTKDAADHPDAVLTDNNADHTMQTLPTIQMAALTTFSAPLGATQIYKIDKQPDITNYSWEVYTDSTLTSLAGPGDVTLASLGAGRENEINVSWKTPGTFYLSVIVTDNLGCMNRVVYGIDIIDNTIVAVPDTATITNPVQLIRVLDNDYDPDQGDIDPTTLTIVKYPGFAGPYHGSVNINKDGTITYIPDLRYSGPDSFVYQICDNVHPYTACDTAIVRLNVKYNAKLIAVDDHFWTYKDQAKTFDVSYNDIDPDGTFDMSSVKVLNPPKHGSFVVGLDGKIKYTPGFGFVGRDSLYYEICNTDKKPQCDQAWVTIDVVENLQIVANRDDISTWTETDVIIPVLKNDFDPEGMIDTTSLAIVNQPEHGSITILPHGKIDYLPGNDFAGLDSFIYRLCDSGTPVTCDTAIVYINVVENKHIVAVRDDVTTGAEVGVVIPVLKNDYDPEGMIDTTSLNVTGKPIHGTVTILANGKIQYLPGDGYAGLDSFIYNLCDKGIPVTCDTAIVFVNVVNNNVAIVARPDTSISLINKPVIISVLNNDYDPDGVIDTSSMVIAEPPMNGNVTIEPNGTISYRPDNGFVGIDSFIYRICDNGPVVSCDTALVKVRVTSNLPPLLAADTNSTTETTAVNELHGSGNLLSNDSDPEGDILTLTAINGDITGTAKGTYGTLKWNSDGTYVYTPNSELDSLAAGEIVTELFSETVSDGHGGVSHTTLTITLTGENDLPVLTNDTNSTVQTATVDQTHGSGNLLANDIDPDGDILTISGINGNTSGTVDGKYGTLIWKSDGTYTYTPNPEMDSLLLNENVVELFTETVSDGKGGSVLSTLTITINGANNPIHAQNDYITIWLDETVDIPVLANDSVLADNSSLVIIQNPIHGFATITKDNTVSYTPETGYTGIDSFRYEVCNNYDVCDTATVIVNIENLKFPELFSPNGDGVNDNYVIQGIEKYPNNRFMVFNRWGNKVYDKVGYLNEWNGWANVKFVIGSKELPVGVYYYILRYNDYREKAGALFLER